MNGANPSQSHLRLLVGYATQTHSTGLVAEPSLALISLLLKEYNQVRSVQGNIADMLEAELHGKLPHDLADREDLLTSAVFGLLKHVPPSVFWPEILGRAKSRDGISFADKCARYGALIDAYDKLTLHFWPNHAEHGQPDLLMVLHGGKHPPIFFIVEVKLWSSKSDNGAKDQLCQYLHILDDVRWLRNLAEFHESFLSGGVIYLTPRAAWEEIDESIACAEDHERATNDLFNLRWQDVTETATEVSLTVPVPYQSMLLDVAELLKHKGLQHFDGFTELPVPVLMPVQPFYPEERFSGFTQFHLDLEPQAAIRFYARMRNNSGTRRAT